MQEIPGRSHHLSIIALDQRHEHWARLQVCKVYIGSFNADKPVRSDLNPAGVELFEKEQSDLLQDLYDIPQRACDRKVWPRCPHAV